MTVIVRNDSTNVVKVDDSRTAAIVKHRPSTTAVDDRHSLATIKEDTQALRVSSPGVQGPPGEDGVSNIPDTDALPEGATNLYFTQQRAADSFDAAMEAVAQGGDGVELAYDPELHVLQATNTDKGSAALAQHESLLDPHPQYIADSETIDGGNF